MREIFTQLSGAVEGSAALALAASALWGILSIVLSPCHLASLPLIVGFISGQERISTRRAFWTATLFSLGILITIAAIGAATAAAGRMLGDVGPWGNYLVAVIFFVVGLHLVGVIALPLTGPSPIDTQRRGLLAAFLLGLLFGIALGPCTFAYMAPMLGVVFRIAGTNPLYGAALLLAYGLGHCAIIVLAGTSTGSVQRYLNWNDQTGKITIIRTTCGALVILGGLYLVYIA